jgi:predicted NACHT family NTPase
MPRIGQEIAGPFKPTLDARAILPKYGPIDTREGQRLAVESAARRIDLQIRAAQNAVPLPPRIHTGIRR